MKYLICFLFFSLLMHGQNPVALHMDETDGLPDVEFYDVLEDNKGFIWLAADKGLYRYDGKEYLHFSNKDQESRSVFFLREDAQGRVWCTNVLGQFLYVEDGQLHLFTDLRDHLKGELAYFFIRDNRLYVSAANSMLYIDLTTKERSPVFKLGSKASYMSVPDLSSGEIQIASKYGIGTLSKDLEYSPILEKNLEFESNFRRVLFKHKGQSYVALRTLDGNKIVRVDFENEQYVDVQIPEELFSGNIPEILYKGDFVFLISDQGIYKGLIQNDRFVTLEILFEEKYTTQFIEDSNGIFWVTTARDGVYVIPNIHLRKFNLEDNSQVTAMAKYNDSTLLFGTSTGKIISYDIQKYKSISATQLKSQGQVNTILYNDKKDLSYISQWSTSGILNHQTGEEFNSPAFSGTKSISLVKEDILLNAAYNRGAWAQLADDGSLVEERILLDRRAYTTYYSQFFKKIYVGYTDHLRSYNQNFDSKVVRDTLKPIFASSIRETADSILWVATYNAGLYGFKDEQIQYHYTEENGLVSNDITRIVPDGNDLWVVGDDGIQRLDGNSKIWQTLKSRDGLAPYRIIDFILVGGQLVFVTNEGFFVVDKKAIFKKRQKAEVYLNQVLIADAVVPLASSYALPDNKNRIQFGFQSNGFQSDKHTVYEYRLLGYDEDWKTTKTGVGEVAYSRLPPGSYTFEVAARHALDSPRGNIVQTPFIVKLPFWKEPLFIYLFLFCSLAGIAWFLWKRVRFRESEKNKQIRALAVDKQITDLKLENLRTQMNPHFIFNALNSIQEYILLNKKDLASDYLGKFADLIRAYLDHSSKGKITIQEEVECLNMYLELEKLRFEDKLEYVIETHKISNLEGNQIPTMLIQPYVENAIKHGLLHKKKDRKLKILFEASSDERDEIICTIVDNGIGRKKAKAFKAKKEKIHKAFATKATKERLALINRSVPQNVGVTIEDLENDNQQAIGTKVTLTIPLTRAA